MDLLRIRPHDVHRDAFVEEIEGRPCGIYGWIAEEVKVLLVFDSVMNENGGRLNSLHFTSTLQEVL